LDGRHLVAGGSGEQLVLWNLGRDEKPPAIAKMARPVVQMQLRALPRQDSGQHIVPRRQAALCVLQDNGQLLIVDLHSTRVLQRIDLQIYAITAFEVSFDVRYLLLAVSDGCLEIRDVKQSLDHAQRRIRQRIQIGAPPHMVIETLEWHAPNSHEQCVSAKPDEDNMQRASFGGNVVLQSSGNLGGSLTASTCVHSGRCSRRCSAQPEQGCVRSSKPLPHETETMSLCSATDHAFEDGRAVQVDNTYESVAPCPRRKHHEKATPSAMQSPDSQRNSTYTLSSSQSLEDYVSLDDGCEKRSVSCFDDTGKPVIGSLQALRGHLLRHGQYPQRDRWRIWSQFLQLPNNRTAFMKYVSAGVCPQFKHLCNRYPRHRKRTLNTLEHVISAVVRCSGVWEDATFLPALAFPFVMVFEGNHVLAFEAIISVLSNWAREWERELPSPPMRVLSRLYRLLQVANPALHAHLHAVCETMNSSTTRPVHTLVLWPMLQTLLSEVLPQHQWLQLWDQLVTHWIQPELLLTATVAFLLQTHDSLMNLPPKSPQAMERCLQTPRKVKMPALLEMMFLLHAEYQQNDWEVADKVLPRRTSSKLLNRPRRARSMDERHFSHRVVRDWYQPDDIHESLPRRNTSVSKNHIDKPVLGSDSGELSDPWDSVCSQGQYSEDGSEQEDRRQTPRQSLRHHGDKRASVAGGNTHSPLAAPSFRQFDEDWINGGERAKDMRCKEGHRQNIEDDEDDSDKNDTEDEVGCKEEDYDYLDTEPENTAEPSLRKENTNAARENPDLCWQPLQLNSPLTTHECTAPWLTASCQVGRKSPALARRQRANLCLT